MILDKLHAFRVQIPLFESSYWFFTCMPTSVREQAYALSTPHIHINQFTNQRRSQRVLLSVRISVSGKCAKGNAFEEITSTLIVNAHGALIQLREAVNQGEQLTIRNVKTEEELICTVVDISTGTNGVQEIGVEFMQPNPKFWRVSFPPSDWTSRSPEAKRFTISPSGVPKSPKQPTDKK